MTKDFFLKELEAKGYCSKISSHIGKAAGPNTYLAEIDSQTQERFERLIEQMKQTQSRTTKGGKHLRMGRQNNIRARAMEIVEKETIFA